MKCIVLFLVIAVLFRLSAEGHEVVGRIFNGHDAIRGQFKYMAALATPVASPDGSRLWKICGGTLIAPNCILTAAHCVEEKEKIAVYLGASDIENAEIGYIIDGSYKSVILHPNYNDTDLSNDIALIRIPKTQQCDKISFARLPYIATNDLAGDMALTMGFGHIGNGGDISTRLQWAHVKVISNDICDEFYGDITDTDLCVDTKKPYGSHCVGDSGGPLLLKDTGEVVGVASAVLKGDCESGNPSVYSRVSSYMPWITKVTGIYF